MPIEVRQLLIKSTVGEATSAPASQTAPELSPERLRNEILAECKTWLEEQLQALRER
ncbi:MAG: DUF5908 family protein [Caulobacteraceae bacterium]